MENRMVIHRVCATFITCQLMKITHTPCALCKYLLTQIVNWKNILNGWYSGVPKRHFVYVESVTYCSI